MKNILFACFALLVSISSSWSAGLIIVDEAHWGPDTTIIIRPPDRPYPMPRPVPPPRVFRFAPLELTMHQANVRITDQVALTAVEEEFYNPNNRQIEGTFLFPVPKGAQLDKFSMEVGGKQVEAELLSADKARGIYEDIVRRAKDPALLEYANRDLFKVRIFPIEPHGKKRIKMSWTQLLKSDTGLVGYTYPLSTEKFSAKLIPTVSLKLELATTRPLKTIYSPSHNVEIRRSGDNKATVGFEAKDVRPDTDFQLFFASEKDDLGVNLMTYKASGEDGYFLLLASPGVDAKDAKVVPKDVVFVLDTSGSMAGQKLEQAKKALLYCVESLNDGDRFEVVRFSTETEAFFNGLTEATRPNRAKATGFIKDLKHTGGTAIDDALKKALSLREGSRRREEAHSSTTESKSQSLVTSPATSDRPYVVIFLTDGLPTIGTTDENQIVGNVAKNSGGNVRVFCFGIGHDVNTHLLDKIAEETRAVSQYVLPEEDIEVKVSNFFAKIKDPVLTSPTLAFTGDIRATKLYPVPLPDLFKGEQAIIVGRYSGNGASAAVVEGKVEGATRKFSYDVKFPDEAKEHDFIPRLWATRRVGYLLEEIRLRGENAELKDEVTQLARQYSIVTPYTAYLIVEDEARRGVPLTQQSLRRLQENREVQLYFRDNSTQSSTERSGLASVSRARNEQAFKSANAPTDAILLGNTEAQRGLAATAPSAGAASAGFGGRRGGAGGRGGRAQAVAGMTADTDNFAAYTQQTQFAGGKSFYQNNGQWIDAGIQQLKNAQTVRVQLNSKEYFTLVANNKEVLPWLALGTQVQFALNNTVYEIFE